MNTLRRIATGALALALACTPALAQQSPPRPAGEPSSPMWLYYIVLAVLVAATVGASVIPSKRGHQD